MRVVVSFSLFGPDENDIYYKGALKNADMYLDLYPEWQMRFYLGRTAQKLKPELLKRPNVQVVDMDEPENQSATFWRFLAVRDRAFDAYIFRDVDGRPLPRELSAVEEWLGSNRQYHVMRDHPRHGTEILAGLWGVKSEGAKLLARKVPDRLHGDYYQVDQDFLRVHVWRHAKRSLITHLGCRWEYRDTDIRPFPVERSDLDFYAGECRMGDDSLRFPEHRDEVAIDRRGRKVAQLVLPSEPA